MAHTPKFNTNGVERTELSKLKIGDYIWGTIWKKDDENKLEVSFNENDPKYESGWTKVTEDCWFKFKKGSLILGNFYNSYYGSTFEAEVAPAQSYGRFLLSNNVFNSNTLRLTTLSEAKSIGNMNDTLNLSNASNIFGYWVKYINANTWYDSYGGVIIQEFINSQGLYPEMLTYTSTVFSKLDIAGLDQLGIILVHDYVDNPNSENIYY